jgi:hypothetical protein
MCSWAVTLPRAATLSFCTGRSAACQALDLDQAGAAWNQDQPGEAGVILQPHLTQGPVADDDGAGLEGGISFEQGGHERRARGLVQFSA